MTYNDPATQLFVAQGEKVVFGDDVKCWMLGISAISNNGCKLMINVPALLSKPESRFAIDLSGANCPLS